MYISIHSLWLNTLLKHPWHQLQPQVFLNMMQQAWHTYFWAKFPKSFPEFIPFFFAGPLKLYQVGWERRWTAIFRSLQRCSIGFKSGLWLGHSRTFT